MNLKSCPNAGCPLHRVGMGERKYCTRCGDKLIEPTTLTCPVCESETEEHYVHCAQCGVNLEKEEVERKHLDMEENLKHKEK